MFNRRRRTVRRRKTYQLGIYRRRIGGHARRMVRSLGGMSVVPGSAPRSMLSRNALMINYGCTQYPSWAEEQWFQWINHPHNVMVSSNKLTCFRAMMRNDIDTLLWTQDQTEANQWLRKGKSVFARTILRGSRGDGIVYCDPMVLATVPAAPLYTLNWLKTHEFRVHVAGGQVVDFVEKKAARSRDVARIVRNHAGGWVFAHDDLSTTSEVLGNLAVCAVDACGLDFAGVDIMAILEEGNPPRAVKKAVVCEVNSAPAWECTKTFFAYKRYFNACINQR